MGTLNVTNLNLDGTLNADDAIITNGVGLVSIQTFTTAGSHTWTKPAGIRRVRVFVTGGGGGGGSHNTDDAQGGGGGGGTAIKIIDVSSISSVAVTVGAGGNGSSGNTNSGGTSGGTSSFGSHCSATGGDPPNNWAVGGSSGAGIGGDINLVGGHGTGGNIDGSGNEETGGNGGSTFWGGGAAGGSNWQARKTSTLYGTGGAGTHAASNNDGAPGVAGIVVVEEYK